MITIEKKRFGLNYTEIWFPNDEWKNTKCDMIRLHCFPTPEGFKKTEIEMQHTRILWSWLIVLLAKHSSMTYEDHIRMKLR